MNRGIDATMKNIHSIFVHFYVFIFLYHSILFFIRLPT
jgi:hypothetical protein